MPNHLHALALAAALVVTPALAHEAADPVEMASAPAVDPELAEVAAVVDRFGAALQAGDMATVTELLDERVLVLESGGAERSREEYLAHHAGSDAAFLGSATVSKLRRSGGIDGDLAWLGTESEITRGAGAEAKTLLSTESMVLRRIPAGWRIAHIHWSSRPKKQ